MNDRYRTLSPDGHARAEQLVTLLSDQPITRVMASPATRCQQTLQPLATATGCELLEIEALWEGSLIDDALAALAVDVDGAVVACSHGDIIPGLIDRLGEMNVPITGRGCELGSIWVLDYVDGRWERATYAGAGHDVDLSSVA